MERESEPHTGVRGRKKRRISDLFSINVISSIPVGSNVGTASLSFEFYQVKQ